MHRYLMWRVPNGTDFGALFGLSIKQCLMSNVADKMEPNISYVVFDFSLLFSWCVWFGTFIEAYDTCMFPEVLAKFWRLVGDANFNMFPKKYGKKASKWAMGTSGSFKIVRTTASYFFSPSGHGKWAKTVLFRIFANYSNAKIFRRYPRVPNESWRPGDSENVVVFNSMIF